MRLMLAALDTRRGVGRVVRLKGVLERAAGGRDRRLHRVMVLKTCFGCDLQKVRGPTGLDAQVMDLARESLSVHRCGSGVTIRHPLIDGTNFPMLVDQGDAHRTGWDFTWEWRAPVVVSEALKFHGEFEGLPALDRDEEPVIVLATECELLQVLLCARGVWRRGLLCIEVSPRTAVAFCGERLSFGRRVVGLEGVFELAAGGEEVLVGDL